MSEFNKIKIIDEEESIKTTWEKILPIEKDGKKYTINAKKMTRFAGVLVVLFTVIQLLTAPTEESIQSPNFLNETKFSKNAVTSEVPQALSHEVSGLANEKPKGKATKYTGSLVISRPIDLTRIPPGSMFDARLVSGASNGLIRAEATSPLSIAGELLIPAGAVLVGSGNSKEERLVVKFTQVVFRDGSISNFDAYACDKSDKIVGLKGSKIGDTALHLTGALSLGFLGGFSEGMQSSRGQQGVEVKDPTLGNALLNGTATAALQESQNLMSDLKDRTPIIEVPSGTDICVIASGSNP